MNALHVSFSALNNLWGEAFLTACFLQNRIPYKKTGLSLYELWKEYKLNLKIYESVGVPSQSDVTRFKEKENRI